MTGTLAWPPTKGDLERLYLVEGLSAAKIAKVYGLQYKNPKVAESTVLYHLKRNGIDRRDPAQHVRKVTEEMVDEWVVRYLTGESLKRIAEDLVGPVTVWNHLKARGLVLRDKVEAQIKAVTKYERKPFSGDSIERAYLMGLRYGDLHAVKHGRAVRVRVSTTHPAVANLFDSLFSPYGFVHRYPRRAELVDYEWTLECDIDESFGFLLHRASINEIVSMPYLHFRCFLAGLFDAEGTIYFHQKQNPNFEIYLTNTDWRLLRVICARLSQAGYNPRLEHLIQDPSRFGEPTVGEIWRVVLSRTDDVRRVLRSLALRHEEKTVKARLALNFLGGDAVIDEHGLPEGWYSCLMKIHRDTHDFEEAAAIALKESGASEQW